MNYHLDDTIAAIGTPVAGAARGMIRIAGEQAIECVASLFRPHDSACSPRDVQFASVLPGTIQLEAIPGLPIACDLFVWPDRRSYTKTPLVELHLLGSPPLLEATLQELCRHGARLAQPGEFTLHAFLAGRIDLTQAEAVLGVIDARGEMELDTALRQLAGGLSGPLDAIRNTLLDLLAHLEAGLDFVEEDIEFISADELTAQLATATDRLAEIMLQLENRTESIEAVRLVLVGDPNVGKSSLYNALLRHVGEREQLTSVEALVSPISGTTRDYLAARFELAGQACELVDTAGIELLDTSDDSIAKAAQHGSEEHSRTARMRLLCFDASRALSEPESLRLATAETHDLVIYTKADLPTKIAIQPGVVLTSSERGLGIEAVWQAIAERLAAFEENSGGTMSTTSRCRESIVLAEESLRTARKLARSGGQEELVAAEVRTALNELGQVVGAVYTDDILDRVFSRFCIGK